MLLHIYVFMELPICIINICGRWVGGTGDLNPSVRRFYLYQMSADLLLRYAYIYFQEFSSYPSTPTEYTYRFKSSEKVIVSADMYTPLSWVERRLKTFFGMEVKAVLIQPT